MDITIPEEGNIANGDLSYAELVKRIDKGSIHIPEFQREFLERAENHQLKYYTFRTGEHIDHLIETLSQSLGSPEPV